MGDVTDRNTPVYYMPVRVAIMRPDSELEFFSDVTIHNADGQQIDDDHPVPIATAEERAMLMAWFNRLMDAYGTAEGLTLLRVEFR